MVSLAELLEKIHGKLVLVREPIYDGSGRHRVHVHVAVETGYRLAFGGRVWTDSPAPGGWITSYIEQADRN